jgi:hypothetical protein
MYLPRERTLSDILHARSKAKHPNRRFGANEWPLRAVRSPLSDDESSRGETMGEGHGISGDTGRVAFSTTTTVHTSSCPFDQGALQGLGATGLWISAPIFLR